MAIVIRLEHLALAGICAALVASAPHPSVAAEAHLLVPGPYHGEEVTAKNGETWLALVRGERGADRLVRVTLVVRTVRDELLDEENGPATGKLVTAVPGGDSIAFLVQNVSGVNEGAVATVATDLSLSPGAPLEFAVGGHDYRVELQCAPPMRGTGYEPAPCSLVVSRGLDRQTIRTYEAYYQEGAFGAVGDDAVPRILWAGDLNHDDALDLLIDLTDHYNVIRPTLLLSPGQGHGELLLQVAEHRSVGC